MASGRIEQAIARIEAALARIETVRPDPATEATGEAQVSDERLREEVAGTLRDLDALIADLEQNAQSTGLER